MEVWAAKNDKDKFLAHFPQVYCYLSDAKSFRATLIIYTRFLSSTKLSNALNIINLFEESSSLSTISWLGCVDMGVWIGDVDFLSGDLIIQFASDDLVAIFALT